MYPLCTHLIPRYRIDSECLNAENPLNYWINVNNARCDKWTNAVRVRYAPPKQYNPNLRPIGQEFGFIVFIEEIED